MYRQDVPTIGSVACSPDPTAALRASVVYNQAAAVRLPTWPLLAALVGELPPVRRGRRGPPLHAVPRPQGSRQHYVLSRSLLGRARRSAAWLVNRRASHPRAYGARPIPGADARLRAMSCRVLVLEDSDSHASRQALRLFPRATVIGNAAGCHTRYEDPGPSHLLLGEKSNKCAGPPCGVAIATSIHCSPSAVPGLPRRKCA
jgi:hypothetical protein